MKIESTDLITVDLDYFTINKKYHNAVKLLKPLMMAAPQVIMIDYHEKIVECGLIPNGTTTVYNVDYHNDIVTDAEDDLNEGTWGNFMPKSVKNFVWMYPNALECIKMEQGICVPSSPDKKDYPVNYKRIKGYSTLPKFFNSLVICNSPNWADPSPILKELEIPYDTPIRCKRIK